MLARLRARLFGDTAPAEACDDPLLLFQRLQASRSYSLSSFRARNYAALVSAILRKTVPAVGDYILSCVAEPDGTGSDALIADGWREVWPDIEGDLNAKLSAKLGVTEAAHVAWLRELRLRHWPEAPPELWPRRREQSAHPNDEGSRVVALRTWPLALLCCRGTRCPRLWAHVRARLLHAAFPADQSPHPKVTALLLVLNVSAFGQLCNWTNLLTFLLIDRTDEHQLCTFILTNRSFHFVVYGGTAAPQTASPSQPSRRLAA